MDREGEVNSLALGEASLKKTGKFRTNLRGGGGKKNKKIWDKFPKMSQFQFGNCDNPGEDLDYSKMSELGEPSLKKRRENLGRIPKGVEKNVPISIWEL